MSQACLDKHLLTTSGGNGGGTKYYIGTGTGEFSTTVQLPAGLECAHCVLQWRYVGGNNWGVCPDGEGRVGCGLQEEFRACADIGRQLLYYS